MSATRDLLEANSFSRRRLVTAFLSGAPGGREVEPARDGRLLLGGLVLVLLLVGGTLIVTMLAPDWPLERLLGPPR